MSKPRYRWWSYIKAVIRNYPALCDQLNELRSSAPLLATKISSSTAIHRETEIIALRSLPPLEQCEYEAVKRAIETTGRYVDAKDRLFLIKAVLFNRTHSIAGAAALIPTSETTAKKWHGDFIRLVAKYFFASLNIVP